MQMFNLIGRLNYDVYLYNVLIIVCKKKTFSIKVQVFISLQCIICQGKKTFQNGPFFAYICFDYISQIVNVKT